jgi:hypothetical protein
MFNYVRAYLLDSNNNVAAMGTGWINYDTGEYVVEMPNPGPGNYTLWVIATSRNYVVGEYIPPPPFISPTPTPSASPSPTPTPSPSSSTATVSLMTVSTSPSPTPSPTPTSQAGGALAPEYGIAEPYVSTTVVITVLPSPTPTPTETPSPTPSPSPTATPTPTPSASPTPTPSPTCRPILTTGVSWLDNILFCIGSYGITVAVVLLALIFILMILHRT